jgi:hypothetical protein
VILSLQRILESDSYPVLTKTEEDELRVQEVISS